MAGERQGQRATPPQMVKEVGRLWVPTSGAQAGVVAVRQSALQSLQAMVGQVD